jgi:hypothetical protein
MTYHLNKEERKFYESKGLFCYDLRDSCLFMDGGTIEKYVLVNNCGSIIMNKKIDILEVGGYISLDFLLKNSIDMDEDDLLALANEDIMERIGQNEILLDYVGNDVQKRPVYRVNNEKNYVKDISFGGENKLCLCAVYPKNKFEGDIDYKFDISKFDSIKVISSKELELPDNIKKYQYNYQYNMENEIEY